MRIIAQPFSDETLGDLLQACLKGDKGNFHTFQGAIAFAKRSGAQHIVEELKVFAERGRFVRMAIGIDQQGTSIEGLADLMEAVGPNGEIWINHDESSFVTFHPKMYLFEGDDHAIFIVGSGNLTQGGLYSNDEGMGIFELDLENEEDRAALNEAKSAIEDWCDNQVGIAHILDDKFLQELSEKGYIKPESEMRGDGLPEAEDFDDEEKEKEPAEGKALLFGKRKGRRRPPKPKKPIPTKKKPKAPVPVVTPAEEPTSFVMTLMRTDVGTGQTTPGTSRRSPEIFIPLRARNTNTDFWGWPSEFAEDAARPGKFDRFGVKMRIGGETINVNMMTWPVKHDFRLRSEKLRSAGEINDIIRIEKSDGSHGFDYYVEIIPGGTVHHDHYLGFCTNRTPNTQRRWGYI